MTQLTLIGSKFNNTSVLKFGNISAVSFHATKILNTGEGVAAVLQAAKKITILLIV